MEIILADASQAVEETTAEVVTLPDTIQLTDTAGSSAMPITIVSLVAVILAAALIIFAVWRRHKGTAAMVVGGIATYVVFYLIGGGRIANFILNMLPSGVSSNKGIKILIGAIVTSGFAVLGRILVLRLYQNKLGKLSASTGIGVGLVVMEGLVSIVNYFSYMIFYSTLNKSGWETFIADSSTQKMLDAYVNMYEFEPGLHLAILGWTVVMMVTHIAVSVPLLAAYKSKVSKGWYAICLAYFFILECGYYSFVLDAMKVGVWMGMSFVATAFFALFCFRMYKKYYADEAFSHIREKEEEIQSSKKMPRFNNLSKL